MVPNDSQIVPNDSQMDSNDFHKLSQKTTNLNEECDNYLDVDYCVQDLGNLNVNMRQTWT